MRKLMYRLRVCRGVLLLPWLIVMSLGIEASTKQLYWSEWRLSPALEKNRKFYSLHILNALSQQKEYQVFFSTPEKLPEGKNFLFKSSIMERRYGYLLVLDLRSASDKKFSKEIGVEIRNSKDIIPELKKALSVMFLGDTYPVEPKNLLENAVESVIPMEIEEAEGAIVSADGAVGAFPPQEKASVEGATPDESLSEDGRVDSVPPTTTALSVSDPDQHVKIYRPLKSRTKIVPMPEPELVLDNRVRPQETDETLLIPSDFMAENPRPQKADPRGPPIDLGELRLRGGLRRASYEIKHIVPLTNRFSATEIELDWRRALRRGSKKTDINIWASLSKPVGLSQLKLSPEIKVAGEHVWHNVYKSFYTSLGVYFYKSSFFMLLERDKGLQTHNLSMVSLRPLLGYEETLWGIDLDLSLSFSKSMALWSNRIESQDLSNLSCDTLEAALGVLVVPNLWAIFAYEHGNFTGYLGPEEHDIKLRVWRLGVEWRL